MSVVLLREESTRARVIEIQKNKVYFTTDEGQKNIKLCYAAARTSRSLAQSGLALAINERWRNAWSWKLELFCFILRFPLGIQCYDRSLLSLAITNGCYALRFHFHSILTRQPSSPQSAVSHFSHIIFSYKTLEWIKTKRKKMRRIHSLRLLRGGRWHRSLVDAEKWKSGKCAQDIQRLTFLRRIRLQSSAVELNAIKSINCNELRIHKQRAAGVFFNFSFRTFFLLFQF